MSGLPRSGSTLLVNLLNQHPCVYASPHSNLLDGLWALDQTFAISEAINYQLRVNAYKNIVKNLPQVFYADINKEIIIDKQFTWTTPANYDLALKISESPRFIVCYRPILEVLASFVTKAIKNSNFFLNQDLDNSIFYPKLYLSRNDALAEFLMQRHGLIEKSLLGLAHAKQREASGEFKFISYDALVKDPRNVLSSLFEFLMIEPYNVKIKDLKNIFQYTDSNVVGIEDFHQIRPQIKKESTKPEDLFSDFILSKYNNALAPIGF